MHTLTRTQGGGGDDRFYGGTRSGYTDGVATNTFYGEGGNDYFQAGKSTARSPGATIFNSFYGLRACCARGIDRATDLPNCLASVSVEPAAALCFAAAAACASDAIVHAPSSALRTPCALPTTRWRWRRHPASGLCGPVLDEHPYRYARARAVERWWW